MRQGVRQGVRLGRPVCALARAFARLVVRPVQQHFGADSPGFCRFCSQNGFEVIFVRAAFAMAAAMMGAAPKPGGGARKLLTFYSGWSTTGTKHSFDGNLPAFLQEVTMPQCHTITPS